MVSDKGVLRSLRAFKITLHVKNIDIRHRFPFLTERKLIFKSLCWLKCVTLK